ncbi:MAG: PAS domain-containing protein [Candidatus Lindowbacteria bacterium]|nr:PAS domain-containing protein [Candidatus Lindowbacteria bacterium]
MRRNKRIFLLLVIMAAVSIGVGGIVLTSLYRTSVEQQRRRLIEMVKSQARLIEAMARFDASRYAGSDPEAALAFTFEELKDAHGHFGGLGETGEFVVAGLEGDQIAFLLRNRHGDSANPLPVPFSSKVAEPMRRVLSGESGSIIGLDYRGVRVLAAYEPVAELNLGLVAKIDMTEIRAPFIKAGLLAGACGLVLIFLGAALFLRVSNPIIQRLEESREDLNRAQAVARTGSWRLNVHVNELRWFLATVHPDDREYVDRKWKAALRGEPYDIEHRIVVGDAIMWVRERAELEFGKDGTVLGGFGTTQDITERKWMEERLRLSHRFLQISFRHSRMHPLLDEYVREIQALTNCGAIGVRILDDEGNIPYEAYVGFSDKFYRSESPLSIKSDKCMCINVIKGSIDPTLSFYTKGGSFCMNGATRFLATVSEKEKGTTRNTCNQHGYESVALVPIRTGEGVLGLIHLADHRENMVPLFIVEVLEAAASQLGTAIERVRAEEELAKSESRYRHLSESLEETVKKQVAELRQAQTLAALGQMVSVVAHEIRNPLHTINLGIDSLQKAVGEVKEKSEVADIVEEIAYGSKWMNSVIEELLYYARPVTLAHSWQPVRDIIDGALSLTGHRLQNISVHVDVDQTKIFVDAERMARVLVNLISNAADAMPDGGKLKIYTQRRETDDAGILRLCVSDSGCGMSEETLEKIYEPFFTTKIRGAGLGIPICKKLIEAHDGALTIISKVGQGTTAEITLPLTA